MNWKKILTIAILALIIIGSGYVIFANFIKAFPPKPLSLDFPKVDSTKSFTVVVLPDIQHYSDFYPEILCGQTQWIVDHAKELNIAFVSELGDITNRVASSTKQWTNASKCFMNLDGKIPYGVIPGNHDLDAYNKVRSFDRYNKYFPPERFSGNSWYKGSFEGNRNNYEIVSAGGKDLMFLNLEVEPSDRELAWAGKVIKDNPGANVILTTHKYLGIGMTQPENRVDYLPDGNSGQGIWDKLVYPNCSIFMVWSGHFHGENRIEKKNSCGNKVKQIVQDYQDFENGGNGWLRLYVFTPEKHEADVYTYSSYLGEMKDGTDSRFKLSPVLQ
jgi:hypothetical protein